MLCAGAALPVLSAQAGSLTTIYSFKGGSDGAYPEAPVIYEGGKLFGTTASGGGNAHCNYNNDFDCGTVYAIDPGTGAETLLHAFTGADGGNPVAGLTYVKGELYGTTLLVGTCGYDGCGTVFKVNAKTGAESTVHSFGGRLTGDGANPYAGVAYQGGLLYGTTSGGGLSENGADVGLVYSLDPATGAETFPYIFGNGGDGGTPYGGVIYHAGLLYGTTTQGGDPNCKCGTVFSLDPTNGTLTGLHSFTGGGDGADPVATLIEVGNTLYGTTQAGAFGFGTVFSIDLKSMAYKVIYRFQGGSDGAYPQGSLIDQKGTLYGTTTSGGGSGCNGAGCGTVFKITTKGKETVLYSFTGGADGGIPLGGVIMQGSELYGTTFGGGTAGFGTVFRLKP